MAYDEHLAERVRDATEPDIDEKKMFGGIAFLLDGNMAVCVSGEELMVRVGKDDVDAALALDDVRPFDMSGKRMAGWILVGGEAIAEDAGLSHWINIGMDFAATLPAK
ncbi:MAG: TfoX/Sxy family protein [Acidimicrobiia bacterium]|nr:MAG: TfoX/Sxy family protein [Acidimicrobiia bacterium]